LPLLGGGVFAGVVQELADAANGEAHGGGDLGVGASLLAQLDRYLSLGGGTGQDLGELPAVGEITACGVSNGTERLVTCSLPTPQLLRGGAPHQQLLATNPPNSRSPGPVRHIRPIFHEYNRYPVYPRTRPIRPIFGQHYRNPPG